MPMMGWKEIDGKKRRVVYCSRDMDCTFWGITSSEVRRHEHLVHPRGQTENDLTKINPLFRRK